MSSFFTEYYIESNRAAKSEQVLYCNIIVQSPVRTYTPTMYLDFKLDPKATVNQPVTEGKHTTSSARYNNIVNAIYGLDKH